MKSIITEVSMKRALISLTMWMALLAVLTLLTAPIAMASTGVFRVVAPAVEQPTFNVTISVYTGDALVADGLNGLFHTSQNNTWLDFSQSQPENVSISGPARVQFVNGIVQAQGVIVISLEEATLHVDLGQLDGDDDNPFEIGAGGGCLENLTGLLTTPENPEGALVPVHFDFFLPDSSS